MVHLMKYLKDGTEHGKIYGSLNVMSLRREHGTVIGSSVIDIDSEVNMSKVES